MTDRMMNDGTSDDSFFDDLERVAKRLSVVTDRAGTDELRRLFSERHGDEAQDRENAGDETDGKEV